MRKMNYYERVVLKQMKRKYVLAGCIISALLIMFSFPVMADEIPEVDAGASSNSAPLLDSYFWENYDLLPYIENTQSVYIDTGIKASDKLITNIMFSNMDLQISNYSGLFGEVDSGYTNQYFARFYFINDSLYFGFGNSNYDTEINVPYYYINTLKYDLNDIYFNNNLIYTFENTPSFSSSSNIYIYAINIPSQR